MLPRSPHARIRAANCGQATRLVPADVLDQHMQVHQRGLVHALRQAGLRKRAGRTEMQGIAIVGERARIGPRERCPLSPLFP